MPEEPLAGHGRADVSCLEEPLCGIRLSARVLRLQIVPWLWLAAVFAGVRSALASAANEVEDGHIHGAGAEGRQLQIVGNYELVVRSMASAQGNPLRGLAILLLCLFLPGEEEAAVAAVVQAVDGSARVDIELRLDSSQQECPE